MPQAGDSVQLVGRQALSVLDLSTEDKGMAPAPMRVLALPLLVKLLVTGQRFAGLDIQCPALTTLVLCCNSPLDAEYIAPRFQALSGVPRLSTLMLCRLPHCLDLQAVTTLR